MGMSSQGNYFATSVSAPKVSVIVPAYNVGKYIREALNSLQKQSFFNFEVLIVDDGSTDNTAAITKEFGRIDNRFQLLQKANGGLSSARNFGISNAKGEYIALLDGDDVYHADKLARHVAILDTYRDVGVVYSASRTIRDDGRPTIIALSGKPLYPDPVLALLCKNFIGHGSNAIFRRTLINEVGGFNEGLRSSEDVDFWLRVAATRRWKFYRDNRILCYYRVRPSGLSFNVLQMENSGQQVIQGALKLLPELVEPMLPTAYAYMYRYLARLCLQGGDTNKAHDYIHLAWTFDKSIFYRDIRSLVTLLSVRLLPVAKIAIGKSLGNITPMSK